MLTEILPANANAILKAVNLLKKGSIVALPTETVYGLAGRTFDKAALKKIFKAKGRPSHDPLIVHVPVPEHVGGETPTSSDRFAQILHKLQSKSFDERMVWIDHLVELKVLSSDISLLFDHETLELIERTLRAHWPGPLTVVLPKHSHVSDTATSGQPTVALRSPAHPVFAEVLALLKEPLCAPSANRFGHVSPTSAAHVFDDLCGEIPLILDSGPTAIGIESTIVQFYPKKQFALLRPGAFDVSLLQEMGWKITSKELAGVKSAGQISERLDHTQIEPKEDIPPGSTSPAESIARGGGIAPENIAPGEMPSHYAPDKPLIYFNKATCSSLGLNEHSGKQRLAEVLLEKLETLYPDFQQSKQQKRGLVLSLELIEQPLKEHFKNVLGQIEFRELYTQAPKDWDAELAKSLFGILRDFEHSDFDWMAILPLPIGSSLSIAIDNRLTKASWKYP
ncbi:MAG: hypothetical protein COT74_00085 [Bdellovibrionales bacterium CG10_big_fil_rev_8_21_14_0_10_45_34]|nr:MAG: hypothetical protein COT74_00085 [Bdellovibrionales bacterium CG10_big_fil_rev_8_21_14_0_10_45_34]